MEAPNRGSGGKNCNQVANFVIIDAFFRKKKGKLNLYQSPSVVCLWVCASVTFLVNVSPPKPLDIAASNFAGTQVI